MKKIFTFSLLVILTFSVNAQTLLTDNFNFTGKLTDNGWRITGTSVVDEILTTTGLVYANYGGSNSGNAANVIGGGQDVHRDFDSVKTDGGIVYASLLLKVTEATAQTGAYFFHLGTKAAGSTTFSNFCARLYAKTDASGNVNFAILNSNATPTYSSTNYKKDSTYLIIIKYTINAAADDNVKMWVKSSDVPLTEAAAGNPDFDVTDGGQNSVSAVAIRQASSQADVVIDGIKIGTTWANSVLPITLKSISASFINNQAQINWQTTSEINAKHFSVEKSFNTTDFSSIGVVSAINANGGNYSFVDAAKSVSQQYYRLKLVDNDGSYKYSAVVAVNGKETIQLQAYPNPVVNTVILSHPKAVVGAVISISGIDGRLLQAYKVQTGATQTSVDVSRFLPNNYIVKYVNNGIVSTSKFVK